MFFGALLDVLADWWLLLGGSGQSPRGPKKPHVRAAQATLALIFLLTVAGAITYLVLTFA